MSERSLWIVHLKFSECDSCTSIYSSFDEANEEFNEMKDYYNNLNYPGGLGDSSLNFPVSLFIAPVFESFQIKKRDL